MPLETAEELVEWATRMALSLTFMPGRTDAGRPETVAAMVTNLLVPGVRAEIYPRPLSQATIQPTTPAKELP